MKKIFSILFLGLLFTSLLVGIVHAQSGIDWSNPSATFNTYPEIVQQVFDDFGIPNTTGGEIPEYTKVDGRNCAPAGKDTYYFQHGERITFLNGVTNLQSDLQIPEIVILDEREIVYRNLKLHLWKFTFTAPIEHGIEQYGAVELTPGSGILYGFDMSDTCVPSFGNHTPNIEDVMKNFVDTIYLYGYAGAGEDLGETGVPAEEVYIYPTNEPMEEPQPAPDDQQDMLEYEQMQSEIPPRGFPIGMAGAAAVGAMVGAAAVGLGQALRPVKKAPMAQSPLNGNLVPLERARWEANQLEAGLTYNPKNDAFEYVPHAEEQGRVAPSYLANIVEAKMKPVREKIRDTRDASIAQSRARVRSAYEEDFVRNQSEYDRNMRDAKFYNRALAVAAVTEKVSDVLIDSLADVTGPAGKSVQQVYKRVKDVIKLGNDIKDKGWKEGTKTFVKDKASDVAKDYIMDKVPVPYEFKRRGDNSFIDALGNNLQKEVMGNKYDDTVDNLDEIRKNNLKKLNRITAPKTGRAK